MDESEKKKKTQITKKNKNEARSKSKIDHYFPAGSLDIFEEEDYYDTPSSSSSSQPHSLQDNFDQFRGKLRQMFTPPEPRDLKKIQGERKKLEHNGQKDSSTPRPKKKKYVPKEYVYIQMKLNIQFVSPEFMKELEDYRLGGIGIRRANNEDIGIFVKLYNRAFMRGLDPWSPATEKQFDEILNHKNTVVLIASTQGQDVGFIITDLEGSLNEIGVVCGLGVDPRYQRRGIARFLGIAAWDYFRKRNVIELQCEVYESNSPSFQLIQSLRFEEFGRKVYKF
jgi:ribosomal protein S18 acetylase RimI-like enzyme